MFTFSCMPCLSLYQTRFGVLLMAASRNCFVCHASLLSLYVFCHLRKRNRISSSDIGVAQMSITPSNWSVIRGICSLSASRISPVSPRLLSMINRTASCTFHPCRFAKITSAFAASSLSTATLSTKLCEKCASGSVSLIISNALSVQPARYK